MLAQLNLIILYQINVLKFFQNSHRQVQNMASTIDAFLDLELSGLIPPEISELTGLTSL